MADKIAFGLPRELGTCSLYSNRSLIHLCESVFHS